MKATTLIHPIIERAQTNPDHLTLVMIEEDGAETRLTALEFHQQATRYAHALRQIDVGPEDLVILVLEHSQVLLSAFWGALYLGDGLYEQDLLENIFAQSWDRIEEFQLRYPVFSGNLIQGKIRPLYP